MTTPSDAFVRVNPPNVNPSGRTAVERLRSSKLSDQREGLGDYDVSRISLAVKGRASIDIRSMITDATIARTIAGASTLEIVVNDDQRKLIRSGIFGPALTLNDDYNQSALGQQVSFFRPVDTELDGLWFRLVAFKKSGDTITLTFEDREVAVLRSYPKANDPNTYHNFPQDWTRSRVMRWLIQQPKEFRTPIRIVSPMLAVPNPILKASERPSAVAKGVTHAPGFPKKNSGVTVKGFPASATQLSNIERVLDTGVSMHVDRPLLVAAVMVITQESVALTSATNGTHVGLFQQDSDPKSSWTNLGGATRDPHSDAYAFFTVAQKLEPGYASSDLSGLCEGVQVSGNQAGYAQWRNEAENTVSVYLGTDSGNPHTTGRQTDLLSNGFFARGQVNIVGNTKIAIREDNWTALQRLAAEVGWRCYCVSGTIYIETDAQIMAGAVRYELSEQTEGVSGIDLQIDTGRSRAQATVTADATTWQAPPGTVCALSDMGPGDGRWFVSSIQRSLFRPGATITLQKPQPTLLDAESATPIQSTSLPESGTGQTAETAVGTVLTSRQLAQKLLGELGHGWIDDNGRGKAQIEKVAKGEKLIGPDGVGPVRLDARTMRVILWLIDQGFVIGTYAWCEDHPTYDGHDGHGHVNGKCVDISSVNGVAIATDSTQAKVNTMMVARLLNGLTGDLAPRQLICGGYGNHRDQIISALSIPAADAYYGAKTMQDHTNHVHVGY